MSKDPWTDPDPQPGDFDAELPRLDESAFEYHESDPSATLRIAEPRGQRPSDVVAELLRDAERPSP